MWSNGRSGCGLVSNTWFKLKIWEVRGKKKALIADTVKLLGSDKMQGIYIRKQYRSGRDGRVRSGSLLEEREREEHNMSLRHKDCEDKFKEGCGREGGTEGGRFAHSPCSFNLHSTGTPSHLLFLLLPLHLFLLQRLRGTQGLRHPVR